MSKRRGRRYCGLRRGEVGRVAISDLDVDKETIEIVKIYIFPLYLTILKS